MMDFFLFITFEVNSGFPAMLMLATINMLWMRIEVSDLSFIIVTLQVLDLCVGLMDICRL